TTSLFSWPAISAEHHQPLVVGATPASPALPDTPTPCNSDSSTPISRQDRHRLQRPLGERFVALDPRGPPGLFLRNTLREEPPGTILVELDRGIHGHPRRRSQHPIAIVPQRDPLAAGITGDRQPQRGSIHGRGIPQYPRQTPHERVQHRCEPAPLLQTRFPDG